MYNFATSVLLVVISLEKRIENIGNQIGRVDRMLASGKFGEGSLRLIILELCIGTRPLFSHGVWIP